MVQIVGNLSSNFPCGMKRVDLIVLASCSHDVRDTDVITKPHRGSQTETHRHTLRWRDSGKPGNQRVVAAQVRVRCSQFHFPSFINRERTMSDWSYLIRPENVRRCRGKVNTPLYIIATARLLTYRVHLFFIDLLSLTFCSVERLRWWDHHVSHALSLDVNLSHKNH